MNRAASLFAPVVVGLCCFAFGIPQTGYCSRTTAEKVFANAPDEFFVPFGERAVAVYAEPLPATDLTVARTVAAFLRERGLETRLVADEALADPEKVNPRNTVVLVIPESQTFPARSVEYVKAFVAAGGHILTLNGPAFSNPCWRHPDSALGWYDKKTILARRAEIETERRLFGFEPTDAMDPSKFIRDTNTPERPVPPVIVANGADGTDHALYVEIENFGAWESWGIPLDEPPDAEYDFTVFWAKGAKHTTMLSLEWRERDGSRWIAAVDLTPEWKRYVVPKSEFHYWHGSPTGKSRGGKGDQVRLTQAAVLRVGLALSHTFVSHGYQAYWFDEIGLANDPYKGLIGDYEAPVFDTISPDYKMYPIHTLDSVRTTPFLEGAAMASHRCREYKPFSPIWRAFATGFDNNRIERFIPVAQALDAHGLHAGTLAHMALQLDSAYPLSIFAGVTFRDSKAYREFDILRFVEHIAREIDRGLFLAEGGSDLYAYFHDADTVRLGAKVANLRPDARAARVRIAVTDPETETTVFEREATHQADRGMENVVEFDWNPEGFAAPLYVVTVELHENDALVDRLEHEFTVFTPNPDPDYMTVRDGRFVLGKTGEAWFPFGLNYMPSYLVAHENRTYFEHYLDPRNYDPEIIDTDLYRIRHVLGLNTVNLFVYSGRPENLNLIDLLNRCRKYDLRVALALRPFANPLKFDWASPYELLTRYRLPQQDDLLFSYDIAWEPWFGPYEQRSAEDRHWERWILDHYGDLETAEADWGFEVPLDKEGLVTGPSNAQLEEEGPWLRMVCAYRRFVDDHLHNRYNHVIRRIKEVDPNRLVSYRASESGNPHCPQNEYPIDVRSTAAAVDFYQPEAYGRMSVKYEATRTCVFTAWLLKSLIDKAVFWSEFGYTHWNGSNFATSDARREVGRAMYDNFLRVILESRSCGFNSWYYAGGYRFDERSDYGALDPDGGLRPLQQAFDRHREAILERGETPEALEAAAFRPDVWLTYDRDLYVDGVRGIYRQIEDEFWTHVDAGRVVGLAPVGWDTTSVDTPATAVGNTPFTGRNPHKHLNAAFDSFHIRIGTDDWRRVENGDTVKVPAGVPVRARLEVRNLGDAAWVPPSDRDDTAGAVWLSSVEGSDLRLSRPVATAARFGDIVAFEEAAATGLAPGPLDLVLRMEARDRAWFGEVFRLRLVVE